MPNMMVALPNIGGALCSTPQSFARAHCRAVTLPIGERKTLRTQSEFFTWQNFVTEQQPWKMYIYIYSLAAQVRAKHCAKFGWLPLSDVAAVTKPRLESR